MLGKLRIAIHFHQTPSFIRAFMSPADTVAKPDRLVRRLALATLHIMGWRIQGGVPSIPKYVLIGAPHTSNWDFVLALLAKRALDIRFKWIGKDSLFRWPFGGIMEWLGGIPVNRRSRNNFIDRMADQFHASGELVVVITPEGTRGRTEYWKSGFYYLALRAGVPIVLGYVDYARKTLGIGPVLTPTGNLEADMTPIREFYADKSGLYPHRKGEVRILPRD
ncbi:MAG: lysophospholipid acyltransferase family protein [Acidiferrobacterales bacterium]